MELNNSKAIIIRLPVSQTSSGFHSMWEGSDFFFFLHVQVGVNLVVLYRIVTIIMYVDAHKFAGQGKKLNVIPTSFFFFFLASNSIPNYLLELSQPT